MRVTRLIALPVLVLAGTAALTGSGAAADGVDAGSTSPTANGVFPCGGETTFFQDAVSTGPDYTLPAGVITSFTVMGATNNPGTMSLRTAKEGPNDTYTITGASAAHALTSGHLNTFLARVPVNAGDVLGFHAEGDLQVSGCSYTPAAAAGDVLRFVNGQGHTDPVGTVAVTNGLAASLRLNISARVEPDADGDGFGDVTQDLCPALKNSHDDCTPPDTIVTSAPKKLVTTKKSAKAKIVFVGTESGTTFTCAVDAAAAKPCTSPLSLKLKKGTHTVKITATDAVGNVDPTPVTLKLKVKEKGR